MSEIEYNAVSACKFEAGGKVRGGGAPGDDEDIGDDGACWQPNGGVGGGGSAAGSVDPSDRQLDCVHSSQSAIIRIAPMDRVNRRKRSSPVRWRGDVHFHHLLKAARGGSATGGGAAEAGSSSSFEVVVLFEALAREGLTVALSPEPSYSEGLYEITFGANSNTKTTISRRLRRRRAARRTAAKKTDDEEEEEAGDGGGGEGKKEKEEEIKQEEGADGASGAASAAGGGRAALDLVSSRPCRVCHERTWTSYWVVCCNGGGVYAGVGKVPGRNALALMPPPPPDDDGDEVRPDEDDDNPPPRYVGFGNAGVADRQAPAPLKVRNVRVCSGGAGIPESLKSHLASLTMDQLLNETSVSPMDAELSGLGGEEGEDDMDEETRALMKEYQEECRKAQARANKFGVQYVAPSLDAFVPWSQARKVKANPTSGFITGVDLYNPEEKAKQDARKKRFGIVSSTTANQDPLKQEEGGEGAGEAVDGADGEGFGSRQPLPVIQAWDNEKLVRRHRVDPPSSLWLIPPPASADEDAAAAAAAADSFAMDEDKPTLVSEKVHIFSIDWAAFKQIRTQDVMRHFSIYGPSYVEWLGDLSCNVHFEDRFSAKRAIENLSQEIPTPPPDEVALLMKASSLPPSSRQPTPEEGMKNDEGKGDAEEEKEGRQEEEDPDKNENESPPVDFGNMGWRFGKQPLRKIANDRYGRRGTTARLLMRVATSIDILEKRPSSWPKPPPGFTTKRVLGPGSDFPRGRDNRDGRDGSERRRNEKRTRRNDEGRNEPRKPVSEEDLLGGGLRAGRAGFSVEEMEAERAKKKAKTHQDDNAAS